MSSLPGFLNLGSTSQMDGLKAEETVFRGQCIPEHCAWELPIRRHKAFELVKRFHKRLPRKQALNRCDLKCPWVSIFSPPSRKHWAWGCIATDYHIQDGTTSSCLLFFRDKNAFQVFQVTVLQCLLSGDLSRSTLNKETQEIYPRVTAQQIYKLLLSYF